MKGKPFVADELLAKLMASGLVPPLCKRVIIDLQAGSAAQIYYETYADRQLLDLVIPEQGFRIVDEERKG